MVCHHGGQVIEKSSPGRKDHYLHFREKGNAGEDLARWAVAALGNPLWGEPIGRGSRPPHSPSVLAAWPPQLRLTDAEIEAPGDARAVHWSQGEA